MNGSHQGFVSLMERLFEVRRKRDTNVIPLPQTIFSDREVAEMALTQLEGANTVLRDIGIVGAANANRLFVLRMREQLRRNSNEGEK